MCENQLIELVRQMRERQKAYFKTRSRDDLAGSRELEKAVDRLLSDLNKSQEKLFNG